MFLYYFQQKLTKNASLIVFFKPNSNQSTITQSFLSEVIVLVVQKKGQDKIINCSSRDLLVIFPWFGWVADVLDHHLLKPFAPTPSL